MKTALVTGAAGFVGSHLCEALLEQGLTVLGVDSFSDHYARSLKELNLADLRGTDGFELFERDLAEAPADDLVDGVDVVFHLAGRPGVRASWGQFDDYVRANVVATKRLLDACAGRPLRFVFASSSSIYGDAEQLPVTEDTSSRPISPYGATKLMTETLAAAYEAGHGLDTVGLRYFTVYGPRQRPDMAVSRFIEAAAEGRPIRLFGDGEQLRDMTFVGDAVAATIAAAGDGRSGGVYNVGSDRPRSVNEIIRLLEEILGTSIDVEREEGKLGDVRDTWASIDKAASDFGYRPAVTLSDGLSLQTAEADRRRSLDSAAA